MKSSPLLSCPLHWVTPDSDRESGDIQMIEITDTLSCGWLFVVCGPSENYFPVHSEKIGVIVEIVKFPIKFNWTTFSLFLYCEIPTNNAIYMQSTVDDMPCLHPTLPRLTRQTGPILNWEWISWTNPISISWKEAISQESEKICWSAQFLSIPNSFIIISYSQQNNREMGGCDTHARSDFNANPTSFDNNCSNRIFTLSFFYLQSLCKKSFYS